MEQIIIAIIAPTAALLGVAMTELFNRWRRREALKRMLFERKIEVYSRLTGMVGDVAHNVFPQREQVGLADYLSKGAYELRLFITANDLILSEAVMAKAYDFIKVAVIAEIEVDERIGQIAVAYRALRKLCKEELGLKALEDDLQRT